MAPAKPLSGIRVLELGAYISGPYAGSILAALGAEVVKIEPPKGDPFRRGIGTDSAYFAQYNAGKRSVAVNLKDPEGVAFVKALLPRFDVVLENSRPGKTEALGLGPEVCRAINPRLVYSSTSGFGDGGPLRDRAAYDSIGQSIGGFYSIMNDAGTPRITGTCAGDLITAIATALGILAALVGRSQDPEGRGMLAQTSLMEAMSALTIDAMTQYHDTGTSPTRESRHPQAQNFCLQTASGAAITLHLSSSQKFWAALARAIERPDLIDDPRFATYFDRDRNYFELRDIIAEAFLRKPAEYWQDSLIRHDVPFAPVLSMEEVSNHPQTEWLDLHSRDDRGRVLVRPPVRFEGERPGRDPRVPEVGEDSRAVAAEILTPSEIDALVARGVLGEHPGADTEQAAG